MIHKNVVCDGYRPLVARRSFKNYMGQKQSKSSRRHHCPISLASRGLHKRLMKRARRRFWYAKKNSKGATYRTLNSSIRSKPAVASVFKAGNIDLDHIVLDFLHLRNPTHFLGTGVNSVRLPLSRIKIEATCCELRVLHAKFLTLLLHQ